MSERFEKVDFAFYFIQIGHTRPNLGGFEAKEWLPNPGGSCNFGAFWVKFDTTIASRRAKNPNINCQFVHFGANYPVKQKKIIREPYSPQVAIITLVVQFIIYIYNIYIFSNLYFFKNLYKKIKVVLNCCGVQGTICRLYPVPLSVPCRSQITMWRALSSTDGLFLYTGSGL